MPSYWIGTPAAESALQDAVPRLGEFWYFSNRTGDHEWLMGSHSSVVHYRILEALDAIGSKGSPLRAIVPDLLRSVPIDSDLVAGPARAVDDPVVVEELIFSAGVDPDPVATAD